MADNLLEQAQANYNYYYYQVEGIKKTIKSLEDQYEEVAQVKRDFSRLQDNFGSHQTYMKTNFDTIFGGDYTIRVMQTYQKDMPAIMSGSEYKTASTGLETGMGIIEEKLQYLRNRLNECDTALTKARGNMNYWAGQVYQLQQGTEG